MIARRIAARPSLGMTGTVWLEISPTSTAVDLGAHLTPADAVRLAGALLLAVQQIADDEQSLSA